MNKRIFLSVFAACFTYLVQAQKASTTNNPYPKHEFSIGIGYYTTHSNLGGTPVMELDKSIPAHEYNSGKYTLSGERETVSIDLGYHHHLFKQWSVGIQAAWQQNYRHKYDIISNEKRGSCRIHNFTLMASCRYYYSITPLEQFYSGLSVGTEDRINRSFYDTDFNHRIKPIVHVTLFGAMVGKRLYGYAELGVGVLGVLRCGAGYRF